MTEISRELKLIVALLPLRFPVAELNTSTGYSKGTISNYLSGKQGTSRRFLNTVIETFEDEFDNFEFKKRLVETVKNYLDIHQIEFQDYIKSIGLPELNAKKADDLLNFGSDTLLDVVKMTSKYIPDFVTLVNNHRRSEIKSLSLRQLTALERTVFLNKKRLSEEDMILFVKIVRRHRDSLLQFPLFKKLVRSLAYTLEIDHEIEDILNS